MGEEGPTRPRLSGAETEGLAGRAASPARPPGPVAQWMPFSGSGASFLVLAPPLPSVAVGCGEMTPECCSRSIHGPPFWTKRGRNWLCL